ncbi:MAG: tRNA epoxyqueuosine(34) reductase QueG [Litorivicinus sp.]
MQFTHDPDDFRLQLNAAASRLGFRRVGVASLDQSDALAHLDRWLADEFHGQMTWMERGRALRAELSQVHPNAQRIVLGVTDYLPADTDPWGVIGDPEKAYLSRYALGRDYHKTLRKRMKHLAGELAPFIDPHGYRVFADSAPVLEKHFAEQAGLGWIGKHTLVLSREAGSWSFISGFLTDAPLPVTGVTEQPRCGSCTACIDICPTAAIVAPYQLDARRCISYHTIEMTGPIPTEFRAAMGNRVFGCDDCQLICPWNRYARPGDAEFAPRHGLEAPDLLWLWGWSRDDFDARTAGMAIRRAGYDKFRENLLIAMGNALPNAAIGAALATCEPATLAQHEHLAWALSRG